MKRIVVLAFAAALIVIQTQRGIADEISYEDYEAAGFPCGTISKGNDISQVGNGLWVQYTISTMGAMDICGQWFVTTSGSVSGVASSATSKTALMYADVQKQVPVPSGDATYISNGVHVSTTSIPFYSVRQESQDDVYIPFGDPPDDSSHDPNSPIVVDVARDGYQFTDVARGVFFDLDADGIAELTAWTQADSDDAFLAMDRNGNGQIDNGKELFGNNTPAYANQADVTTPNGFEALKFLEWAGYGRPASPAALDEVIDANDAAFSRLLLWRDLNHNGVSEPEELTSAAAAGVTAIYTAYKEKKRKDQFGNEFRQKGTLRWADGGTGVAYDVWLQAQR